MCGLGRYRTRNMVTRHRCMASRPFVICYLVIMTTPQNKEEKLKSRLWRGSLFHKQRVQRKALDYDAGHVIH